MKRDESVYLRHILDAIVKAEENLQGLDEITFNGDSLTLESGGTVTIELRPGQSSYQGTTRNGVKSNEYGAYAHSFVVR